MRYTGNTKTTPMKKIYAMFPLLLLLLITISNSCQKEELMMSENKISEQISYTWTKQLTSEQTNITWQFKEGKIYIRQNENIACQGSYTVDCSLTKAKVKIEGFSGGYDFMNNTWQVLTLNKKILVITDLDKGTQVNEFIRKD
jgi:hypothetical protein